MLAVAPDILTGDRLSPRLTPEEAARLRELRSDLQAGVDQLNAAEGRPLDIVDLIQRLNA
jgi:hypothetical protein